MKRATLDRPPRVYRTGGALAGAILATAGSVAFTVVAVVPNKGQLGGYIFAPLLLLVSWRAWNWGAHVDARGVKVCHQFFATRRVAWPDIDHFEVRRAGRYPNVGHLIRKDAHRPVPILAINTSRPERARAASTC